MRIDLRSEVAAPLADPVRRALAQAPDGNDTYDEDASVRALEDYAAELFGVASALFVATGRLANLVATSLYCPPDGEILLDAWAHLLKAEYGSVCTLLGRQTRTFTSPDGVVVPGDVLALVRTGHTTNPNALVAVEDTHSARGGVPQPLPVLRTLSAELGTRGIARYCDGARLWYANADLAVPWTAYGALYDALSVSLVKGPGAPVGALCLFADDRRAEATHVRRRFGGAWARPGPLARAALAALRTGVPRVAEDCGRATRLAELLVEELGTERVTQYTNIVHLSVPDCVAFFDRCAEQGLLLFRADAGHVRAVLHSGVDDAAVHLAAKIMLTAYPERF